MKQESLSLIGLMSGTSGDGLDVVFAHFLHQERWSFEIEASKTFSFPSGLGDRLQNSHRMTALELALLDVEFGKWVGEKVKVFCLENELFPQAIASHGHTVFHQPELGLTKQIGNGWAIHVASGLPVIYDFRMLDVQLGGQGAPLVPIGDMLLFPQVDFCINLGGISNISYHQEGKRIAFDMSPFNLLLNAEARKLGFAYDESGKIAKSGKVDLALLEGLNGLPFYKKQGAKSLGREDLEREFIPLLEQFSLSPADYLCTLVEHFAFQIASTIHSTKKVTTPLVLLTGGGAYNSYFEERLTIHLAGNWEKYQASKELIEFKEALIFAFLGALRLRGDNNSLSSVTGASRDSCGGIMIP